MKKQHLNKKYLTLLIITAIMIITAGCTNPEGTLGPSWNISLRYPLIEYEEMTVEEMLAGTENVNLEGETVTYEKMETIEIGQSLSEIDFSEVNPTSTSIILPLINITNLMDINDNVLLPAGADGNGDPIELVIPHSEFDSIKFSDYSDNNLTISVTAPDFPIESITIEITDLNVPKKTIENIEANESKEISFNLSSKELGHNITFKFSNLETGGTISEEGKATISLIIQNAEIASITGYTGNINENISNTTSTDISGELSNFALNAIEFEQGALELNINLPANLDYNINQINIGGLATSNSSLDLTGKILNLTEGKIDVDYDINITNTGAIDYTAGETGETIDFSFGFSENSSIKSITSTANNKEELLTPQTHNIEDLPQEFDNFSLNELLLEITCTMDNLTADLGDITFTAYDENDSILKEFSLKELGETTISTGTNTISLLSNDESTDDFQDLIKTNPDRIKISGKFLIGDGRQFILDKDDIIDMKLTAPLSFTLENDLEAEIVTDKLEGFTGEQIEMITDGTVKNVSIKARVDNRLPFAARMNLYITEIENSSSLTEEEISKSVFQSDNLITPQAGDYLLAVDGDTIEQDLSIILKPSQAHRFTGDNLYAGLKFIMPSAAMEVDTNDYIKIHNLHTSINVNINNGKVID